MMIKVLFPLILILFSLSVYSQKKDESFSKLTFLEGTWKADGSGKPGQGSGTFTFEKELDGNIFARKSHTEYAATESKAAFSHDDLMILYADTSGSFSKAIYFDNEGHSINYTVLCSDSTVVLLSEPVKGMPSFRLTYFKKKENNIDIRFEIAFSGKAEDFFTYVEGTATRKQ